MKTKKSFRFFAILIIISMIAMGNANADQGEMFRRNVSRIPAGSTEYASIGMMHFYVPAQKADGTLTDIEYYDTNNTLVETREFAKPMIAGYVDEPEYSQLTSGPGDMIIEGGVEFGLRRDAFAAVSFDDGATWKQTNLSGTSHLSSFYLANGLPYPGDVHYMPYIAVEGEYVLAAWISKYCAGGTPAYTWKDEANELIYEDLFGVAGAQGSVNYTLQGHPEVGEIPYGCVWTARGTLEEVLDEGGTPTGGHAIEWRKAERLTSGRRDANLVQIAGVPGAGFVMVWQEDPEGLRPGQGEGPGEGWSGAVVNQKTDMWYSYISWADFAMTDATIVDTTPKVAVPFSVPIRITDNNACRPYNPNNPDANQPYCQTDFNGSGTFDFCAEIVDWKNPGGQEIKICKTEDGRVLSGRTGASRTRLSVQGYEKGEDGIDSAWVIMAYEENKALGAELDPDTGEPVDIGKNIWYHSFDMFEPDLVSQGTMLNAPARDPESGEFFGTIEDEWENDLYITDIARRFSLMAQPITKFYGTQATSGASAIAIFKQGADRQGGPADIMLRRFVIPVGFDPKVDNPYTFENMECGNWLPDENGEVIFIAGNRIYTDGSNPNYLNGLCLAPPINVSGTNANEIIETTSYPRVTKWSQTPSNLTDEWWANPYDVSKGHRGFIDGDFVMMMYAWSPNWNQNAVGNDHYNLYIRRSFDGGVTWTTTPADYVHWDGTEGIGVGITTCENWGVGSEQYPVCTDYGAGDFEQARNVSQLTGNKITILDPRFTPTSGPKATGDILTDEVALYPNDVRDPSKFFVVYETGDNTTVVEGEATPLNLYYSRATAWGDEYYEVEYYNQNTDETYYSWDWLENQQEDLSGEACVWSDPGGNFFYAIWNQWREDEHEHAYDSDAWFRRVMWTDEGTTSSISSKILYFSHATAAYPTNELLTFVGTTTGRPAVDYLWTSDLDGVLSTSKQFSIPAKDLSMGPHTISFSAKDADGNWSTPVTKIITITGYQLYLPALSH
jgi:hypothetical protein